ncbi:GNAT family N-acetyltransferase [Chitinilyticum piscinae]|uniref:GNAT family N-acetyltransferase n=1 Tax=Chitinilyticum piscinae TaxID=2866724 RepID=A0A8J7K0N0_9NEIS|nr:GNAT family N-acetyltransferase [Chitinilyticum piscinae]MBE9608171.1 GNAT family N-acetyltransferase [Chitinilyticum piscinae]
MLPDLTTARLTLRRFTPADLDALHALTSLPEIHALLPDWQMPRAALARYLADWQCWYGDWQDALSGWFYAITLTQTGELIGWIGLWEKPGLGLPWPELTYALAPAWRGQGLASEAAGAACAALFARCPGLAAIAAIALDANPASQALLARCGFLPRGRARLPQEAEDYALFILPRPDLLTAFPLQLRPAGQADVLALAGIQQAAFADHYRRWGPWNPLDGDEAGTGGRGSPELIRYQLRATQYSCIEAGGVLLGGVAYSGPFAGLAYMDDLYVDPALGRRGIGLAALALLEQTVPEAWQWELGTSAASEDNARFYRRCGYEETGCEAGFRYFRKTLGGPTAAANVQRGSAESGALWHDCWLENAVFSNCALPGLQLNNASLVDARLHNVNATGLCIGDARLARLELCHGSWGGAHLHDLARGWNNDPEPVTLERCDLGGARLHDCDLRDASISGGQLDGLMIDGVPYAELLAAWLAREPPHADRQSLPL